jgi:hypothetical protein
VRSLFKWLINLINSFHWHFVTYVIYAQWKPVKPPLLYQLFFLLFSTIRLCLPAENANRKVLRYLLCLSNTQQPWRGGCGPWRHHSIQGRKLSSLATDNRQSWGYELTAGARLTMHTSILHNAVFLHTALTRILYKLKWFALTSIHTHSGAVTLTSITFKQYNWTTNTITKRATLPTLLSPRLQHRILEVPCSSHWPSNLLPCSKIVPVPQNTPRPLPFTLIPSFNTKQHVTS